MPNYCHNDLWIDGEKADIDALLKLVGADQDPPRFDFNAVIPYPEQFTAFIEKHGPSARDVFNSGVIEWCRTNWGTKWNASYVARRDYQGVVVTFQTAWSPPIPVIVAIAEKFPAVRLSLEYFEMGMAFSGGIAFHRYEGNDLMSREEWFAKDYHGHRGG